MDIPDESLLDVLISPGTCAVVVLLVMTGSCIVATLCLYLRRRTAAAHEMHCGHCHTLLAVQGVRTAPVELPPIPCLVNNDVLKSQELLAGQRNGLYQAAMHSYSTPGGNTGPVEGRDYSKENPTILMIPESKELEPVFITTMSQKISQTQLLMKDRSLIVHPKLPFQRICSTRKKVFPQYRCPPYEGEGVQAEQHWLDISQMCRTVLSRISPRQRLSKPDGLPLTTAAEEAKNRHVAPYVHNYIHPLNDVERYNALVLEANSQAHVPSSPYGYIVGGGLKRTNRMSWGSTLPEYAEFLI